MDSLPRDLRVEIAKGVGLDGLRALGVRPGRLRVPASLADALAASFAHRRERLDRNGDWCVSFVALRVGADKHYLLTRRQADDYDARGVELWVELVRTTGPFRRQTVASVLMCRGPLSPDDCVLQTTLVDLSSWRRWRSPPADRPHAFDRSMRWCSIPGTN